MTRIFAFVALLLGGLTVAFVTADMPLSPPAPDSGSAKTTPAPGGGPAIWRVGRGDGALYLFGSFHLMKTSSGGGPDWLTPVVRDAFAASDVLVVEIDPGRIGEARMAQALGRRARLPAGTELADVLSPEVHARLRARAAGSGFPPGFFDSFRPWFVGLVLTQGVLADEGFESAAGADAHFLRRARADGRPVVELESLDDQVEALAAMAGQDGDRYLAELMDQLSGSAAFFDDLYALWRTGDVAGLAAHVERERDRDPAAFEAVYRSRNVAWVPRIEALLDDPAGHFIVVGAGHLVGVEGVVAMLRRRGHDVIRLDGADGLGELSRESG